MASKWNGCTVSVTCINGLGVYQGLVSEVNPETQTILLSKPFKNGVPCREPQVALSAHIIEDIKIIENVNIPSTSIVSSTVPVSKPVPKRAHRTVSENIAQCNKPGSSLNNLANKQFTKTLSVNESPRKALNDADTFQSALFANSNKKNPRHKWTERDEACFGAPIKPHYFMKEFDFEKNLALFNKQAIFDEINAQQRPDLVRQTDRPQRAYRPDDNASSRFRQILVPQPGGRDYVTDEGMIVPSISSGLREQLFLLAEEAGLSFARHAELMGRAAAEVAIPLLGGPHRLNPLSTQRRPLVVVLASPHRPGALAVNTARQLASQGVETALFLSHAASYDPAFDQELVLYKQTGQRVTDNIQELPVSGVDLAVVGLKEERTARVLRTVAAWLADSRPVTLALDPPAHGTPGVPVRYSLLPALPLSHTHDNGMLFLVNTAIPHKVFSQLNIRYRSPFGPKFVIPLHPKD